MALTMAGLYAAVAALFYLRLTATATGELAPKLEHSHWHRARRMTKSLGRRVRPAAHKH